MLGHPIRQQFIPIYNEGKSERSFQSEIVCNRFWNLFKRCRVGIALLPIFPHFPGTLVSSYRITLDNPNVVSWDWEVRSLADLESTPALANGLLFMAGEGANCTHLNLNGFHNIHGIHFQQSSFAHVEVLVLEGLNQLEVFSVASGALLDIQSIIIASTSLSELQYFDMRAFRNLRLLSVGMYSLTKANQINVDGLYLLENVEVAEGAFMMGEL